MYFECIYLKLRFIIHKIHANVQFIKPSSRIEMRKSFILVAFALIFSNHAYAQPKDLCSQLMEAYDQSAKSASLSWAQGVGDNSAPRATLRELEISNQLIARQINLTLMIQYKCPLPRTPASSNEYISNAVSCSTALLMNKKSPPECDLKKWKRD